MNPEVSTNKEPHYIFILSLVAFLELIVAGIVTLILPSDLKGAIIFGFSLLRLLLVGGIWIQAGVILLLGVRAKRYQLSFNPVWLVNLKPALRFLIYGASSILILWGAIALIIPAPWLGKFVYYFQRMQPYSIAMGIILVQYWLSLRLRLDERFFLIFDKDTLQSFIRPILLFSSIVIVIAIYMSSTKFGLLSNLIYTNVPGIPLTEIQLILSILLVIIWVIVFTSRIEKSSIYKIVKKYRLIPILIFISAVLVWGFTPMLKHFFSLQPELPSYQPFPYSDARIYDEGGISILRGYGIYFHQIADKPLYMVYTAILHLFSGPDYTVKIWLQIFVLALIPVILFLLGERFHSPLFGIFISLILIIRQRNAIILSYKINSVNPKLFMTEELTLLGVILFIYLVSLWIQDRKLMNAYYCGIVIAAIVLIRLNALFLFPIAGCMIVALFWRMGRKYVVKHLAVYTLAFLIIMLPATVSNVDSQGIPWAWVKFRTIFIQRYEGMRDSPIENLGVSQYEKNGRWKLEKKAVSGVLASNIQPETTIDPDKIVTRFLYHLFHNFSTSIMALPDSSVFDNLSKLSQRIYWIYLGNWDGNLPFNQVVMVSTNLILLAIGLGYAWVHLRWVGMLPLLIFITYCLSLAAAMNSGGRYIVPIDWIIFFYYGLAILVIIKFVYKIIMGKSEERTYIPKVDTGRKKSGWRSIGLPVTGSILLACLIPFANFVLPAVIRSPNNNTKVNEAVATLSANVDPGAVVTYGEILYPYYDSGKLSFDFLLPSGAKGYTIITTPDLIVDFASEEKVIIILQNENQEVSQIEAIYLLQDEKPVLIWSYEP
jgi:hypothetical protein